MSAIASQITSLTIVYSIIYSDADQTKHLSLVWYMLLFLWLTGELDLNNYKSIRFYWLNIEDNAKIGIALW